MAEHEDLEYWPFGADGRVERMHVLAATRSDSAVALRQLAVSGLGIIRLADFVVSDALVDGSLIAVLEDRHVGEEFPIWAIYAPAERISPRLWAFLDVLAEIAMPSRAHSGALDVSQTRHAPKLKPCRDLAD